MAIGTSLNRLAGLVLLLALSTAWGQPTQLTFSAPYTFRSGIDWSPDGDWISCSFGDPQGRGYWLVKVSPTGGVEIPISTVDLGFQITPQWSADAQGIFFLRDPLGAGFDGFPAWIPAAGGPMTVLSTRPTWEFSLSRNAKRFLHSFGPIDRPYRGMGLLRVPTRVDQTLMPLNSGTWQLSFAPDSRIASYRQGQGIWIQWPFGALPVPVFSAPSYCIFTWSWSPFGDRLAISVTARCVSPWEELVWLSLSDGMLHSLDHRFVRGYPVWSRCGRHVAVGEFSAPYNLVLYEIPSGQSRVIPFPSPGYFCWSPFRDEIAWLGRWGIPPRTDIFKVSTGLPPIPAIIGTMELGSTNTVRIRDASQASLPYVIGASFASEPGIPTPRGTIPLALDPLLVASLSGGFFFQGFQGILDVAGRVDAYLTVPLDAALVGTRIFIGYITIDSAQPGGIGRISDSVPVFVQPLD